MFQSILTSILDNTSQDTLEKETENDDIVVSVNDIKAAPLIVFIQDVINFATSALDDYIEIEDDEIHVNEVKAALLVKSLFPSLGAPKCPR